MAKEWILNVATNRWSLNKKNFVGPVSKWIRECSPKDLNEWRSFYLHRLSEFLRTKRIELTAEQYLEELGKKLYVKITEVIKSEVNEVSEEDCINYIYNLVIKRTYEGYLAEIDTIYGQLERELKIKMKPAPDEWDRLFNVDFYIEINGKFIGIQIKPISYEQAPEVHKWKEWLLESHKKFQQKYGGKVFVLFSVKRDNKKEIFNKEVIAEIKEEIRKLKESTSK